MDINWRGKGWSPIYFDPDFDEILELTKSFDTLRIGLKLERSKYHLVIASGLGNTHSTLSRALGEMNPRCKPSRIDGLKYGGLNGTSIYYEENNRFWFNMCDMGGKENELPDKAIKMFPTEIQPFLKDIHRCACDRIEHV